MNLFVWALRLSALFILGAGLMHVGLGLKADVLLGANVSAATLVDPGLDSQNRFYGASFLLYAVLLALVSTNVPKYVVVLQCLLWVFIFAGLVRFISVVLYGWPPLLIGLLFAAELLLPPLMLVWLGRLPLQSRVQSSND